MKTMNKNKKKSNKTTNEQHSTQMETTKCVKKRSIHGKSSLSISEIVATNMISPCLLSYASEFKYGMQCGYIYVFIIHTDIC